jgi:hypothetical protein
MDHSVPSSPEHTHQTFICQKIVPVGSPSLLFSLVSFLLLLLIYQILVGQLSYSAYLSHSHWSAFFYHSSSSVLIGQLSYSPAQSSHSHWSVFFFPAHHSSHSHWPAFFYPCSFVTFSLVSFHPYRSSSSGLIGQLSSSPVLIYHILIGHWSAFLYCCSSSVLIGQLSSTATYQLFPFVSLFFSALLFIIVAGFQIFFGELFSSSAHFVSLSLVGFFFCY